MKVAMQSPNAFGQNDLGIPIGCPAGNSPNSIAYNSFIKTTGPNQIGVGAFDSTKPINRQIQVEKKVA